MIILIAFTLTVMFTSLFGLMAVTPMISEASVQQPAKPQVVCFEARRDDNSRGHDLDAA